MARFHARIIQLPFAASLQGAILDSYQEEWSKNRLQLTLAIRSLQQSNSEIFEQDGTIYERVQGSYIPAEVCFSGISNLQNNGFFKNMARLAPNDPARTVSDLFCWQPPGKQDHFFLFFMQEADNLMFFARHSRYSTLSQESVPIRLKRNWCPPPSMPVRLVPKPEQLHRRFGGDPITLMIKNRVYDHRLFIGGVDIQPNERPNVDVVFNIGEKPSQWVKEDQTYSQDRWDNKGEGNEGMSLEEIRKEAEWVIERLKKNQRVLVHCAAGMNRSSTICCAVLILLEGVTAEQALERVREHHPWARPDSGHWLKLRWLAKGNS